MKNKKEIERKFLVKYLPANFDANYYDVICQYYLSVLRNEEIRIRKINKNYILTVKTGEGLVRNEFEVLISEEAFNRLAANHISAIFKQRHYVQLDKNLVAEIDIYLSHQDGLQIVEVEFSDEIQAVNFTIPSWFGEEVTGNSQFSNRNLHKWTKPLK